MFRRINLCSSDDKKISWWWLGVKIGAVTALIIWWWLENKNKQSLQEIVGDGAYAEPKSIPLPVEETTQAPVTTPTAAAANAAKPDDLTKVEGIGPKINAALQQAGLRTFAQLAASEPAALKQILKDAGIRLGYPATWPEQAALAAKGDWAALEALQADLQGGRRVAS